MEVAPTAAYAAARPIRIVDNFRRSVSLIAYGGLTALAFLGAHLLRFEFAIPPDYVPGMIQGGLVLVVIRLLMSHVFRLSTGRWRFIGTRDVLRLAIAVGAGSALFVPAAYLLPLSHNIPRSVLLLEPALSMLFIAGLWISYRTGFEFVRHSRSDGGRMRSVLVVGAGEAGEMLVRQMYRFPTGLRPVGFVDDDPLRWRTQVHGVQVLGGSADLVSIAQRTGAEEIVIAVPSADPADLRRIVECCERTNLPFRVLPGIAEVLAGEVNVAQLREVRIEDLLGREPVQLELPELADDLAGRCVLITGAAGSIGSELSRQVAMHRPARLVLLDQAETELYYLELELRELAPDLDIVPIIGDVVEASSVERVFRLHSPHRVFHAAAYKHVPMMECNTREAVCNNVIGTWRVADAAGRHGAGKFVLVSTDKAVRPTSVMGATKRMSELAVLGLQAAHPATSYSAVRFGNVLGSNGSVIPIFRRQLAAGRPLTVTHPDATRYFMTIPEAVQLILKGSLLPEMRGHIAMLDMGQPVRISDLARNLLRLSGAAGRDENLRYTGLRPGEKLHEELVAPDERTAATAVPKLRLVMTPGTRFPNLPAVMREWEEALLEGRDQDVDAALQSLFPALRIGADVAPPPTPRPAPRPAATEGRAPLASAARSRLAP